MAVGRLANLKESSFVRTDPILGCCIGQNILHLPTDPFTVWDPSCGTGSLFSISSHTPWARLFGIEISAERAEECRSHWPRATIIRAAFEATTMHGLVDLIATNPPYFFQNGKRAELRFVSEAGEHLRPGGVMVAILSARSSWDGYMINHFLRWYDHIRVWKFPDRTSPDQEGVFDDYKQIVVVGVRRTREAIPLKEEKKRLQGWAWRNPEKYTRGEWQGNDIPPDIPESPIADPYIVPSSHDIPRIVVRNADESTLLYALKDGGAHLSPVWQKATTWKEGGYLGVPTMPYTGEAHVAAEIMVGGLDGEIVWGPTDEYGSPHLFTAFVGQEWKNRVVEDEMKKKLVEQGCIRVELKELSEKPILGVLNLRQGTTRYYQGEEVFTFLQPWLQRLSSQVVEKRQPLYRLDPSDWEIRVMTQFGTDKRLPNAEFPGLAVPQLHRVFAMGRALDVHGRSAIQGEPGTGKTRLATATAARQGYRWRHRNGEFKHTIRPAWVRGLRRSWLKNPRTLSILGLEPVYDSHRGIAQESSRKGRIVAYRELSTGKLIAPEEAGPAALPVLIATPLKVVKEYAREIESAFPQAEVVHIESHRDILKWFECCARTSAPVVFGIISHSSKQAFGRRWKPVVREKVHRNYIPELNPDAHLLPTLLPQYDERRKLVGYQMKATGKLLKREIRHRYFHCPDCYGVIKAVPGRKEREEQKGTVSNANILISASTESKTEPVGSRTWFVNKQRWCQCKESRRNQERVARGKSVIRTPLWQDDRLESTNRKHPQISFARWSSAFAALQEVAEQRWENASPKDLVGLVRRDDTLLLRLVEIALSDETMLAEVVKLLGRSDARITSLCAKQMYEWEQFGTRLLGIAFCDEIWTRGWVEQTVQDEARWHHLVEIAERYDGTVSAKMTQINRAWEEHIRAQITQFVETLKEEGTFASFVKKALHHLSILEEIISQISQRWSHLQERLVSLSLRGTREALSRVLTRAALLDPNILISGLLKGSEQEGMAVMFSLMGKETEGLAQAHSPLVSLIAEVIRTHRGAGLELLSVLDLTPYIQASSLVRIACHDIASLVSIVPSITPDLSEVLQRIRSISEAKQQVAERIVQAARHDGSGLIISRLIEVTKSHMNWRPYHFREAYEQARLQSEGAVSKRKRTARLPKKSAPLIAARSRLTMTSEGVISFIERDRDAKTGKENTRKVFTDFRVPPPDSFSPYHYLYRFFKGCVALAVIDESHNGRTKDADISQAFRQAMRASASRLLTSGTHYGGDVLSFYHYWFSFNPSFWLRLGYGWNDAEKALAHYGVIQQWTKEYEGDARKGSGQTTTYVSTIPAPGLSAKLIPGLLEDLAYLTVLDVGAHMPPKLEIPKGLFMHDPILEEKVREAEEMCMQASRALSAIQKAEKEAKEGSESEEQLIRLASLEGECLLAQDALALAKQRLSEVRQWAKARDLAETYTDLVKTLERLGREGNTAARLAQGTIPRWFAALPCDSPYEVYSTKRDDWGDKLEPELVIRTSVLAWDYLYPMERYLIETVQAELAENRSIMVYIEQVTRSMSKRLEWVFSQANIPCWTLPHNIPAEDRQQTILDALNVENHHVVIVPYRLVNEGLNLHNLPHRRGIKTIFWYEQSLNLFMHEQASQRAWRLGADDEVRIHLPFYVGTAAHTKMRKLAGQSGAAAAFAGEVARGELIKRMGADQTTLARLSARLEESLFVERENDELGEEAETDADDLARIEAAFARRNDELRNALSKGRQWFGVIDTLAERVAKMIAERNLSQDIWMHLPLSKSKAQEVVTEASAVPQEVLRQGEGRVEVDATKEPHVSIVSVVKQAKEAESESKTYVVQVGPVVEVEQDTTPKIEKPEPVIQMPSVILIFGDEEDIKRARKQRSTRPRRSLPKLKNPVTVKDIPAAGQPLAPDSSATKQTESELVVLSWWELTMVDEGVV